MDPITGLAILAAGAFANYQNDKAALNRQRKLQASMELFQRKRAGESMAATEEMVKKQTPLARATELSDLTREREQSMRDSVGAAQAFNAPDINAKPSGDRTALAEREAQSVAERTRRAIEQIASMGAPAEQGLKHKIRFGRAAGVVDASNSASDAVGSRYMTDINNVRPNELISLLSKGAMAYGGAVAATPAATPVGGAPGAYGGFDAAAVSGADYGFGTSPLASSAYADRARRLAAANLFANRR